MAMPFWMSLTREETLLGMWTLSFALQVLGKGLCLRLEVQRQSRGSGLYTTKGTMVCSSDCVM